MSQSKTRWVLVGAAVLALAAGAYFGRAALTGTPGTQSQAAIAGLALPDTTGQEQRLDQWRGKVVVVNFWATWCAPCREEMPEFIKAQNEWGAKGLQFVGIAVDSVGKVREFEKEIGLNYPTLVGGAGAMDLSKVLGNEYMALPFSVVIDRKGGIAYTQLGVLKPAKLQELVKQLL